MHTTYAHTEEIQGRGLEGRRAYTKKFEDLAPEDLPALIEADRQKAKEKGRKKLEREEFVREARPDLERLLVNELAEEREAEKEVSR